MCHSYEHSTFQGDYSYVLKIFRYFPQTCNDVVPTYSCYEQSCSNVSRPVFTKKCHEVMDEKCEVIIEQTVEEQCTKVEQKEFEEECTTKYKEECDIVEEYLCDQEVLAEAPITSYGAPQVIV